MPAARAKPRRRQPRQARAVETRATIIEAAARVLSRRGYAGATTNHIAERAGVSIGTLYEYFRNKDQLVTAVVDAHLAVGEALLAERTAALDLGAPLPDVVAALVGGMIELHAADPRLHRVLTAEVPHVRANVARAEALEERMIGVLTAALAQRADVTVRDPALAARVCVHTVEALTHRWVVDARGAPATQATLSDELVRLVVAYLRA
jgi:AcrR family transcriptional regulator